MEANPEPAFGEIKRLQRCIGDLVSLLALPAIWTGGEPSQVLDTLLDSLMRMLSLDLVSVQLKNPAGEMPVEIVRLAKARGPIPPAHEICEALSHSLSDSSRKWPPLLRNFMGEADVSIVPLPLGPQGEFGVILAAAERADFPQQTEALLLSVAASQASIGLQEARFRSQQKRIADELDQRVAERTAELAAANAELQLQVGLLQLLPVSAWTLKPDGTPDFVNHVWLEYSGQTLDFVRSHPEAWMIAVHPEDRETAAKSFWEGVRSGQGFAFETRSLRAQDGTYRWHLQQAGVLRDAEGKVLKFVGTTTDIDDQKRAGEELRASESKLKKIINTIPTAAWSARPDGYCDFINQSWLDYAGLSAEQGLGWGWGAAIHPDDLNWLVEYWQTCLASGTPVETEARMRRFDGVYRWFLFRANPLRDEAGNIIKWYGTNTDIDDRKRAEEKLRTSETNLREILDGIPGLVAAISPAGVPEVMNRPFLEFFGKTAEEMKDWRTANVIHPDDLPRAIAEFTRSLATGTPQDLELRYRRADGVYRWFHARIDPARDADGRITGWYSLITDIDDRKRAQEKLRQEERQLKDSEARKAAILDSALDCIVTIDHEGRITEFNPAAERTFGYASDEVLGKYMADVIIPPSLREKHGKGFARYLATGDARVLGRRIEMTAVRADGSEFPVELSITRTPLDGPPSFTGFLRDITEYKRNESALRAAHAQVTRSEERWRSVFENSAIGVALTDLNGRFLAANPVYEQMLGYTEEELQNLTFLDITQEDDLEASRSLTEDLLSGRVQQFRIEKQYRRKDGSLVWARNNVSVVPGTELVPRFLMALSEDITERKRAEEKLRASESNLRQALDSIPGWVATFSPAGRAAFFNQRILEYFGKTPEEMNAWATNDVVHPDDLPRIMAEFTHSFATGTPFDSELRYRRADGIYRWFQARILPARDLEGGIACWYALVTDIDDRKRAEENLGRSEALLAEVQAVSLTGGFSWHADTDDVTFSEEAYRIFEFEKDVPVTLQQIASRVHPEDIPMLSERMAAARGDGNQDYEIRLRMPDGSLKYLHTMSHGVRDPQGRLEYIGAVQDITRRRLSEEALNKARSALAHVARATTLGVLTASIAHEVNQPLSGIITNASTCLRMLAADPPQVEGARETARRTIRDGNRASEVVTRLRALYSRKDAATDSVNLNEAAAEVIALSSAELQKNRVVLRSEFADDIPPVKGDRVQLQQVILNLLRNGSDAMSAIEDHPRLLLIRTERDEQDCVRLTVQDTGVGFDPHTADRLFDSFYTTKNDGMGIGLSVSRSIIEGHHGRLWATLNDGPGAAFSFSIPCRHEGSAGGDSRGNQTGSVTDAA
jgi:PAS domain S-box-containing protein